MTEDASGDYARPIEQATANPGEVRPTSLWRGVKVGDELTATYGDIEIKARVTEVRVRA